jgi:hypothetical protein
MKRHMTIKYSMTWQEASDIIVAFIRAKEKDPLLKEMDPNITFLDEDGDCANDAVHSIDISFDSNEEDEGVRNADEGGTADRGGVCTGCGKPDEEHFCYSGAGNPGEYYTEERVSKETREPLKEGEESQTCHRCGESYSAAIGYCCCPGA